VESNQRVANADQSGTTDMRRTPRVVQPSIQKWSTGHALLAMNHYEGQRCVVQMRTGRRGAVIWCRDRCKWESVSTWQSCGLRAGVRVGIG
jgi:hypothetical protein